jgi:hypothetical protein
MVELTDLVFESDDEVIGFLPASNQLANDDKERLIEEDDDEDDVDEKTVKEKTWRHAEALKLVGATFPDISPEGKLLVKMKSEGSHKKATACTTTLPAEARRLIFYPPEPSMTGTTIHH